MAVKVKQQDISRHRLGSFGPSVAAPLPLGRVVLATRESSSEAVTAHQGHQARLAVAGEMAARMAHELRNPLGSIALFAALIQKSPDADAARWAGHIATAVGAMNDVISNLLCFAGRPVPHFQQVDLARVIDDARLLALHRLQENRIRFIPSTESLPTAMWGDPQLLRQILLNLILNAVDAMPDGGTLEVAAAPYRGESAFPQHGLLADANRHLSEGRAIVITVTDTGVGIPPEVLPRIFDPFFTTKVKGTGLGLAVVQNAVSAYGGVVWVANQPQGGACFTLVLPAAEVAEVSEDIP